MLVLGIESSCDDTSVALLDCTDQGCFVISEGTISQIDVHQKYGGVVPEIAGRMHAEKIIPLIEQVLKNQPRPDTIAVTVGPGLITGLIVGAEATRTLSYTWNIPLVAVNHISGHINAVEVGEQKIEYPALALIVSGGHTEIMLIKSEGEFELLGATKDDAAGECFDKVAKLLKLTYPGGPKISALAKEGRTDAIPFPRPMIKSHDYDFSFSGLKTSALYWLRDNKLATMNTTPLRTMFSWMPSRYGQAAGPITINDFCASFEQAIVDVLTEKTLNAINKFKPKTVILAGGVAANTKLRETLDFKIKQLLSPPQFLVPEIKYCMDNAVMIAVAGYKKAVKKDFTAWKDLKVDPNWELGR
ncbi:MAG: tRNA (adenosine(37)-N6)-threonylcarbamoyltransferase complex transferase subunit TsaD [bacterium]|nr:tRNA (adenosine(37)-N6)-threonylcarbamoyltransferase complex transferase subunit TsaD [bacterium]